jgi:hypothetical protein
MAHKPNQPRGRTKPPVDAIFALDTAQGYSGFVRAKSATEIAETLFEAKKAGGFAVFTRSDGEELIIDPTQVYLVGKAGEPT